MSKLYVVYYMVDYDHRPIIHGVYDDLKLSENARDNCNYNPDCAYTFISDELILNKDGKDDEDFESDED